MAQPKLDISKESLDKTIETIGIVGVIILLIIPIYFYSQLPDQIPNHFGIDGKPDSYGSKFSIWMMPAIGLGTFLLLNIINKFPHTFNYGKKITKENAYRQYQIATRMIRVINVVVVFVFAYITYYTIQTALDSNNGLGNYFVIFFLVLLFSILGYFTYKSLKKENG